MICKAHHVCPVCHHNHMLTEHAALTNVVAEHYEFGSGFIVNATLTVPHAAQEPLAVVSDRLSGVWAQLRRKASWRALEQALGVTGCIRRLEVKITEAGWHLHYHVAFLCQWSNAWNLKGCSRQALQTEVLAIVANAWADAGKRAGSRVSLLAQAAVAVVAAVDGEKAIAYNAKNMGFDGSPSSLTPFDLLRLIDQSRDTEVIKAAKVLFQEYAMAIKGKHTVTMIGKAREARTVCAQEDAGTIETEERLGVLSPACWQAILGRGLRECVVSVSSSEGLRKIVLTAARLSGFYDVPTGWLVEENKTVISIKDGIRAAMPGHPVCRYGLLARLGSVCVKGRA